VATNSSPFGAAFDTAISVKRALVMVTLGKTARSHHLPSTHKRFQRQTVRLPRVLGLGVQELRWDSSILLVGHVQLGLDWPRQFNPECVKVGS
jgi:hypothetical protein